MLRLVHVIARELHLLPSEIVARGTGQDVIGMAALMRIEQEEAEAEATRRRTERERPPEGSEEALRRELAARAAARLNARGARRR